MSSIQSCMQDIMTWLTDYFLLLNDKKTEIVKFGKQCCKEDIQIGNTNIHTQPCVTSLGCTLDVELNMSMHMTRVCKSANYYLHCIRRIRFWYIPLSRSVWTMVMPCCVVQEIVLSDSLSVYRDNLLGWSVKN